MVLLPFLWSRLLSSPLDFPSVFLSFDFLFAFGVFGAFYCFGVCGLLIVAYFIL